MRDVEALGRRIVAQHADVRDESGLQAAYDAGAAELGAADIVVANAGIAPMALDEKREAWRDVVDVNLTGVFNTVEVAIGSMVRRGSGGSILVGSTSALTGIGGPSRAGLRELRRQPRSRAQLALDINMTKGAVSNLVAELEERRLLRISEEGTPGAVGRPARDVSVVHSRALGLGISLSVDYLVAAVVDLAGETIARHEVPVRTPGLSAGELTSAVVDLAQKVARKPPFGEPGVLLAGVAVGAPDLADARSGTIRRSPTIGLTDFPLGRILQSELACLTRNIQVDNDANLAALAEFRRGSAAGVSNLVYLTGSTGIGGGIISEGRLFRGAAGYAGEVGHMVIDPRGALCTCGSVGCWEAECGLQAFLVAAADESDETRDLRTPLDERFDIVVRRAQQGDFRTLAAVQKAGTSLGLGLSTLINVFNPDVVVLGGYFARLFPFLIEPVRRAVHQRVMAEALAACQIVRSELGLYAGAIGAAHLVIDQIIANPMAVPFAQEGSARIELENAS